MIKLQMVTGKVATDKQFKSNNQDPDIQSFLCHLARWIQCVINSGSLLILKLWFLFHWNMQILIYSELFGVFASLCFFHYGNCGPLAHLFIWYEEFKGQIQSLYILSVLIKYAEEKIKVIVWYITWDPFILPIPDQDNQNLVINFLVKLSFS